MTAAADDASLAEAVASGALDRLDPRLRALCSYALKLTRTPAAMTEDDVAALRAAGLDDRAVVDANQVVSYFNYVNRVADGLGVELEPDWPAHVRGPRTYPLAAHLDDFPAVSADTLPWLSVAEMREVDRLATEEVGLALEQMMENAGRNVALVARRILGGTADGRRIVVFAGPGGNGGGGLVAARQLANGGADVTVALDREPGRLAPVTQRQYAIVRAAGIDAAVGPPAVDDAELVVDALLGYGQSGAPLGETARLIAWSAGRRTLALDVPSGLELGTAVLHDPHARAEATLALALPKAALRTPGVEHATGRLLVGDISIPGVVYERIGRPHDSPFGRSPVVRIA